VTNIEKEMIAERYTNARIQGDKWDQGKLRYDLIPPAPMEELAKVYTIGTKYGDWNWLRGIYYSRIIGAVFRHLYAWLRGEKHDQSDGQHHLASVAWCCFTLIQYEITSPEFDDRPKQTKDLL
jgi:hypothetical protein